MAAEVEGILVSLRFVLVLESIAAVSALVLFLLFMSTKKGISGHLPISSVGSLLEFFLRIEFLRLLGTTLAHEYTLHLGSTIVFGMTHAIRKFARGHQWPRL
jgi:phosphate starvation-inducible membrane PsiE